MIMIENAGSTVKQIAQSKTQSKDQVLRAKDIIYSYDGTSKGLHQHILQDGVQNMETHLCPVNTSTSNQSRADVADSHSQCSRTAVFVDAVTPLECDCPW